MSNRLKEQSSPYLLQHAENPVDWFPWCEDAFQKAKKEDKPVFLSIGYSTCHWCHVMAHESFENQETAELLNRYFISIKVDREERPDIDSVYMAVCQAFTGSGGWPMSIFLTADQKPFFAGTYFPPVSVHHMIGFRDLLLTIAEKWKMERSKLLESAEHIVTLLNVPTDNQCQGIDSSLPKHAAVLFSKSFDAVNGGFGPAPKFPTPHNLIFLMLYARLQKEKSIDDQVKLTLDKMRRGGIFDHIGYGFSRYSTDERYLIPHFEKMLYDNALLIMAYSAAYKAYDHKLFLDTAEKTAAYVFREMTGANGEFYSAQDADSDGEEGKYYVWRYEEVCDILGTKRGNAFCEHFGITKQGNFEGKNIPNLLNGADITDQFEEERKLLYDYRKARAKLHLDDKILTAWNALMICALSLLYRVTGKQRYLTAAQTAQKYIEENLMDGEILYVGCRDNILAVKDADYSNSVPSVKDAGRRKTRSVKGFLDEYAYDTVALLSLYDVTADTAYLKRAESLCREAVRQFADENGGYFLYGTQNSDLITKPKESYDGALPSGNSMMAYCLVRLAQLTQRSDFLHAAEKQLAFMSSAAEQYPAGYSMFLLALLLFENQPQAITVVLAAEDKAEQILPHMSLYADIKILAQASEDYKRLNDKTTYYVCKGYTCFPPTNQAPC